ncbi:MAG: FixH family protein [Pseudomonadota bacterium]
MTTPPPAEQGLPWWKERMVWLVIGLPFSAVVAGIATVVIASHDPDDLVRTGYVKTGMAVATQDTSQLRAAQLGLGARVVYADGELTLALIGRVAWPDALTLTLAHPTQDDLDQQIPLSHVGQGKYQARIQLSGQGKRQLILDAPDKSWRLRGEWLAPFSEETSLHPGA